MDLTHINEQGRAKMVDVSSKEETLREAAAYGCVYMKSETLQRIKEGTVKKGDVLSVAQVAGIMASKKTSDIIPMCHPIIISGCDINFNLNFDENKVEITSTVKTTGQTGVEMEALTAVAAAGLTIYDMCKAIDREMIVSDVMLMKKSGGKSGTFERK
ncbi:MAG TPA: cyclic pyranopterin monophosphate synthase MoaC [Sedimentibacter sp.]|nr:cyclic pyranopterin monophosphate synthase MoaC [Sedimentibacter sp.]HQB64014.1 cyclic pyranopterin monophosphate synthase MoaC [Sedimentibacter sp.]